MKKLFETWRVFLRENLLTTEFSGIKTVDELRDKIRSMPVAKVREIQAEIDEINGEPYSGMTTLYHGTTNKIADKIEKEGFKLTRGTRSGFLGSDIPVDNLAVFLSDNKSLARAFGANRDPYGGPDTKVLEVKADINDTLDMTSWGSQIPKEIRSVALESLENYEGRKIKKPTQADMFWLIDQPEVVEAIRKAGYDSVRFSESRATKKALGEMGGDTIAVFDTSKLHIAVPQISGLQGIINYLNNRGKQ